MRAAVPTGEHPSLPHKRNRAFRLRDRGVDARYIRAQHRRELRIEQRIMRTRQYDRFEWVAKAPARFLDGRAHRRPATLAKLNQRHQCRRRDLLHGYPRLHAMNRGGVRPRSHRCRGSQHADAHRAALHHGLRRRLDQIENRNARRRISELRRYRTRGVTPHHDRIDALLF